MIASDGGVKAFLHGEVFPLDTWNFSTEDSPGGLDAQPATDQNMPAPRTCLLRLWQTDVLWYGFLAEWPSPESVCLQISNLDSSSSSP
jgi:hypothetical protein